MKGEKPPAPSRGLSPAEQVEADEKDDDDAEAGVNVADLVPRNDIRQVLNFSNWKRKKNICKRTGDFERKKTFAILSVFSDKITDELISELADKNWKIRNEGLQKVTAILNEAKFIKPNIGSLPEALKARLGDSNKILVTTTLTICHTIGTAAGPGVKQHVPVLGPGIIANFGDSKPQVRAAASACLSTWVEHCGLAVFVQGEMFSDALKLENPNLRAELLGWLTEKLPSCKKLGPELNLCVPHLFACLEDRNGDVRKKADEAILPFMIHIGFEYMARQAAKLKVPTLNFTLTFFRIEHISTKSRMCSDFVCHACRERQKTKWWKAWRQRGPTCQQSPWRRKLHGQQQLQPPQ